MSYSIESTKVFGDLTGNNTLKMKEKQFKRK